MSEREWRLVIRKGLCMSARSLVGLAQLLAKECPIADEFVKVQLVGLLEQLMMLSEAIDDQMERAECSYEESCDSTSTEQRCPTPTELQDQYDRSKEKPE